MGTIFTLIILALLNTFPDSNHSINLVYAEEYSLGPFQRAVRIASGLDGSIYILDSDQNKLIMYKDLRGDPTSVGGFGWSGGSFDSPSGVATDGVNIYVSDYGNHRIQRFDRKLNFISSFSTRDTSVVPSRFGYPLDIALSAQGDIFILDGENTRVLKFNPIYYYERSFGGTESGAGRLNNPIKLLATDSHVYVAERKRIVIFDSFGNFIGSVGEGKIADVNGFSVFDGNIFAASSDTIWQFDKNGAELGTISIKNLIVSDRIDRVQDITFSDSKLLILSPQRLHVFAIEN